MLNYWNSCAENPGPCLTYKAVTSFTYHILCSINIKIKKYKYKLISCRTQLSINNIFL